MVAFASQFRPLTGASSLNASYDQNGNRTGGIYQTGADNRLLKDNVFSYQYDKEGNLVKQGGATGGTRLQRRSH